MGHQARLAGAPHRRSISRFRGDGELSRVNATAGSWTTVSSGFAELMESALAAYERTSGRFDPTLMGAMVAAGYDRDFDDIVAGARAELHPGRPAGGAGDVQLDGRRLLLPAGTALDLGGVAKGWTVDRAALDAVATGLPWALIDAGGEIRLAGEPPPRGVEIAVEDPEAVETDVGRIVLQDGALATSSVTRRRWGPGLHHLIDPETVAPATGPVLQATVWPRRAPNLTPRPIRPRVPYPLRPTPISLNGPRVVGRVRCSHPNPGTRPFDDCPRSNEPSTEARRPHRGPRGSRPHDHARQRGVPRRSACRPPSPSSPSPSSLVVDIHDRSSPLLL